MRVEQLTAKALVNVNFDRYLLTVAVAKRAEELSKGASPMIEFDKNRSKFADIALREIAEGKIIVSMEG
ncbi:MAG: DNA-directed RNA polymerase subunit omega [Sulfurovum sp.]|nr:DNA-directed RNA polymerase subunit omega [Sulfurovaceae bacterium]